MSAPERQLGKEGCGAVVLHMQGGAWAVRDALRRTIAALEPLALDPEETGTIQIVLAEVLNNIIEHAYPTSPEGGPVRLALGHRQDGLHVCICDRGHAMPDGKLPVDMDAAPSVAPEDLPEGGFGWFLIRDLAKDLRYRRVGEENRLDLRIAVGLS